MQPFDLLFGAIDAGVEALFSIPNIALWIAFALFGWCAWIIAANARRHHRPLTRALAERLDALAPVAEAEDREDARAAFAAHLPAIDAALAAPGPGAAGLRHAWLQYRDTLIDPDASPVEATQRPDGFFLHLGDEGRVLAWWANIFVAVGLTFTFLGIVAALLAAVRAIGAGADPAAMQGALVALLRITAAKFWTSIGGVASSIALRVVDRRWHARTERALLRLCDRLEAGTRLLVPQRLQAAQLELLRRLPAATAAPASDARMAAALAGLADGLGAAHRRIEDAGEAAGDRIGEAARAFAAATERLAETVAALDARVADAGDTLAARADAAVRRTADAAERQSDTLASASDQVRALLGSLGEVVGQVGGVLTPVRAAAQSIERSVTTANDLLDRAHARSAQGEAASRALAEGMDLTAAAATRVWESYRDRFDAVDAALGQALEQLADGSAAHARALAEQVARVDGALAQAVDRLAGALDGIGDLAAALDDVRGELRAGGRR